jgi:hypothetical protein
VNYSSIIAALGAGIILAGCAAEQQPALVNQTSHVNDHATGSIPLSATDTNATSLAGTKPTGSKAWNPSLVVANQTSNSQASVLVFTNAGKTLKRSINVGDVVYGLTADNAGDLFVGSGSSDITFDQVLDAYKHHGAKLVQMLKQKRPFMTPTLDSSQNLYVICNARSVCEYQAAKKTLVNKGIIRRLTIYANSPLALAADATGDIAVMQGLEVDVYKPGAKKPFWIVSDHLYQGGIAFDSTGNLYVASGYRSTGSCIINEYAPGQTTPKRVLSDTAGAFATVLKTDAADNLYAFTPTCKTCPPAAIAVFSPTVSAPTRVIRKGIENFTDEVSVNMVVDASGGIFIDNPGTTSLTVYAPNQSTPLRVISSVPDPTYIAAVPSSETP